MSVTTNQNFQFWQDVLTQLRRIPGCRDGKQLSNRDDRTMSEVIALNAMIVSDMCYYSERRSQRNLKQWCISTKAIDVVLLDNLCKDLLKFFRRTEQTTYARFKHEHADYQSILGTFLAPIRDYIEVFFNDLSPYAFRYINQFLSFMGRTTLRDTTLADVALSDYYIGESRLRDVVYDETILQGINHILKDWLSGFRLDDLNPRHGPGGVAESGRIPQHQKYQNLGMDDRLWYLLKDSNVEECIPRSAETKSVTRRSKVTFVPKSMNSMRTICMEPTSLMYFQEACSDKIDSYFQSHTYLREIIDLHDQSRNRIMAAEGSIYDTKATIDLSSASDSVSWRLVKSVFAGTQYYKACLLTRSLSMTLPDNNCIRPEKFAPMGSAMCFPTQCLIFAGICELVVRRRGFRNWRNIFSVYGDDIIIQRCFADDVIKILTSLGFIVNQSKSFVSSRFKESCGGEYYSGYDVTPVRIPRKYAGGPINKANPGSFPLLIDLANECYHRKWKTARAFLIRKLLELPRGLRPRFDEESSLISDQPTNFHLRKSWVDDYQAYYLEAGEYISRKSRRQKKDEISLFMWFQRARQRPNNIYRFCLPEDTITVESESPNKSLTSVRRPDGAAPE
ncbi:TPA_asm: RNA-directed RNA polymerase [ssRNA phage SRR6960507_1]|uniref:RNA-directed RNA polymerase n=1 Tax=ssRNA phage SRR6960507_1 TaxID=2786507 RepID=A0A8S5KYX2_9VIRU|nr:RNA-directed RNA polymerase [ssRNA phage SRR6960507_1]DAD50617.1 TPA_asm: RNA-directed RNA polymerase [ssRNA phage SRR6960507_1]